MKLSLTITGLLLCGCFAHAQPGTTKKIAATLPPHLALAPLKYLASDELKGRNIERPEINTAAQYIADQFKAAGAKQLTGAAGYFQLFNLKFVAPSTTGTIKLGNATFALGTEAVQTAPADIKLEAEIIYTTKTGNLTANDVKGKIVLLDMGNVNDGNGRQLFGEVDGLKKSFAQKGALAIVERWNAAATFWGEVKGYLGGTRPYDPAQKAGLPFFIINSTTVPDEVTKPNTTASIAISGTKIKELALKNVMAYVAGTDPKLRRQYIMLSSHYDHLGVAPKAQMEEGKLDSIYNGARDNASGTTAVIAAARYFAKYPPKRSVIFIAYTAEEEGLLGSTYYAAHPVLPLKQTVYNLNIDNASYNDTTLISLVGVGRTSADANITKACKAYGLHIGGDPTGGQLFSGSDNFPLAVKGIPAPTFSLGMKTFDGTITNRYHQLSDEVGNMDLNYVMKFIKSYILAAYYIADNPAQPTWTAKDENEVAWKVLFGKK